MQFVASHPQEFDYLPVGRLEGVSSDARDLRKDSERLAQCAVEAASECARGGAPGEKNTV